MKCLSIMLTALLSLFLFTNQSKAQQVTDAARNAFNQKFPDAEQVNWGMEGSDVYEAEFTFNGKQMSANFDSQGNWKETESAIAENDLPYAVRQTLSRDYKELTVKHAFMVENPDQTLYEVEVGNGENHEKMEEDEENEEHEQNEENKEHEYEHEKNVRELVFTQDGKLVHHKKEEEDEEDED